MTVVDLKGRIALVTGVSDNVGFGWHIAKAFQEQGIEVILSSHPRVISILDRFLSGKRYEESRRLKNGGEFCPKAIIPCDVALDTMDDASHELRGSKGYENDVSVQGLGKTLLATTNKVDILVHSIAFSPEIERLQLDVSRHAYLTALSISSYSLIALSRAVLPLMKGISGSLMALSFLAGERAVPFYGGGMATAKAALECDARMLSWQLGAMGHRINIISAGPYPSRAARAVGDMDAMVEAVKSKSPLRRAISPEDVANTALFLASDLSSAITGEIIHVDAGFHAMALV